MNTRGERIAIRDEVKSLVEQILASRQNDASKAIENRTQSEWRELLASAVEARKGFFDLLGQEVIAIKAAKSEIRAEALSTLGAQLNQILDVEWRTSVALVDELLSQVVVDFSGALKNDVVGPAKISIGKLSDSLNGDIERFRAAYQKSQFWTTMAACVVTGTVVGFIVGHWAR